MSILPISPRLASYRGTKENLRRKAQEANAVASRVARHINTLIASNPAEMQQYIFGHIASDLDLTEDQVRSSVYGGGHNGITVRVTEEDRQSLAIYKARPVGGILS